MELLIRDNWCNFVVMEAGITQRCKLPYGPDLDFGVGVRKTILRQNSSIS